jgi:hypothetical protein
VIHRLDVSRPCDAQEMPPLLPMSVENPAEVVTTSKLAVSPLTPSGKRFVYAVDRQDLPMSSLMVFDVSPDSNDRTPLVRRGSTDIPGETPDRLRFSGAIRDVSFVLRDRPQIDPTTGVALVGVACNPHPGGGPGAEYQPRVDTTDDDDPAELRGVFGMVLLSNGQVSVVDVEDFDAPCRRPARVNRSGQMDFRGCANDPDLGIDPLTGEPYDGYFDASGVSVTNEVSCRMVEPHRQRSAEYGITSDSFGIQAPALGSFPQLQLPDNELGRSVVDRPKLLAVDFPRLPDAEQPAEVYVGTTLFRRRTDPTNPPKAELVIDPALAQQHSIALPFVEPRAYISEGLSLEYEGVVAGGMTSGIFAIDGEAGPEPKRLIARDSAGSFCDRGVNDVELMRELGARKFGLSGAELETFAATHTDSLWITDDFLEEDNVWWSRSDRTLGADGGEGCTCTQTRAECQAQFGEFDADELSTARQFRIDDARSDRLLLSGAPACDTKCCFPSGTRYEIRSSNHWVLRGSASGVRHDVVPSSEVITLPSGLAQNCIRDCSPKKRWDDPRIFEIACPEGPTPNLPDPTCAAGVATMADACVLQSLDGLGFSRPNGVIEDESDDKAKAAWRCIYSTPTARFAVYRGLLPSKRGMRFTWSVSGTFKNLGFDLGGLSTAVSPASLSALPDLDWLTIVDSGSLGLVVVDMDDQLRVLTPTSN